MSGVTLYNPAQPGPVVIAHRGASGAEPENTVPAFLRAAALGAHGIELDVRRSADGVLVVHHDPWLPDGRTVASTRANELPASVPTLGEALDACAGCWTNVEIKNHPDEPGFDPTDSIADETIAHLLARNQDAGWLISCFRIETIDRCRTLAPAIRTAWLTTVVPPDAPRVLVERGHIGLHPWVATLTRATIDDCHAAGLVVNTWTCDDPARMTELIGWGIDGICTNDPELALRVLAETPA